MSKSDWATLLFVLFSFGPAIIWMYFDERGERK